MAKSKPLSTEAICKKLQVADGAFVEIEAKRRVLPDQGRSVIKFLENRKRVIHHKSATFFDQFLDTPRFDLLKRGASLRLRYKGPGRVYLQYKGPGFFKDGLLYRSEFSTEPLRRVVLEQSRNHLIHFSKTSIRDILREEAPFEMAEAMGAHLGMRIISQISRAHLICIYQKEKFRMKLDGAALEPSLDRVSVFHIPSTPGGLHPLSSFTEYENEIKSSTGDLESKLAHIGALIKFEAMLERRFHLTVERLDKYHRCASFFIPRP